MSNVKCQKSKVEVKSGHARICAPNWQTFYPCSKTKKTRTLRMKWIAHFAVDILLLHHYESDVAHLSYLDSLVIEISKSER